MHTYASNRSFTKLSLNQRTCYAKILPSYVIQAINVIPSFYGIILARNEITEIPANGDCFWNFLVFAAVIGSAPGPVRPPVCLAGDNGRHLNSPTEHRQQSQIQNKLFTCSFVFMMSVKLWIRFERVVVTKDLYYTNFYPSKTVKSIERILIVFNAWYKVHL